MNYRLLISLLSLLAVSTGVYAETAPNQLQYVDRIFLVGNPSDNQGKKLIRVDLRNIQPLANTCQGITAFESQSAQAFVPVLRKAIQEKRPVELTYEQSTLSDKTAYCQLTEIKLSEIKQAKRAAE